MCVILSAGFDDGEGLVAPWTSKGHIISYLLCLEVRSSSSGFGKETGLEVPISTQTTSYGHLPTPSASGDAEQPSRQLKLYLSLFS